MFSIIWSRTGIKSIVMLKPNEKLNKEFFINKVLGDLKKNYRTRGKILHMDNARPHLVDEYLDKLGMRRLVHPPYSPDLAPSDFYLFGYLKMALEGCFFKNERELFSEVTRILNSIPTSNFKNAYDDWLRRLQLVIDREGEYVI